MNMEAKNKGNIDFEKSVDNINDLVYDECSNASGGVIMPAKELIAAALKATGKTQAEAAAKVGWVPQQFSARMTRNSLRADEFLDILDGVGVEVRLIVKDTGEEVHERISGAGRRVRRMVDKVLYDTAESNALANNFFSDGANKYNDGRARELYIDAEGRYFFAEYSENDGEKDRINPVSASDAADFIERYGTEINKQAEESE